MPLAKSNIETRSRQGEFRVICISDMPKRSEKRDFTQCKELVCWKIVRLHAKKEKTCLVLVLVKIL